MYASFTCFCLLSSQTQNSATKKLAPPSSLDSFLSSLFLESHSLVTTLNFSFSNGSTKPATPFSSAFHHHYFLIIYLAIYLFPNFNRFVNGLDDQ
ncbi:hypothetical protein S83_062347 [Arachis hypogaea]